MCHLRLRWHSSPLDGHLEVPDVRAELVGFAGGGMTDGSFAYFVPYHTGDSFFSGVLACVKGILSAQSKFNIGRATVHSRLAL